MASVSADDVRDVINVSSVEVPDAKVLKMIKRAEVTLRLETGRETHHSRKNNSLVKERKLLLNKKSNRVREGLFSKCLISASAGP